MNEKSRQIQRFRCIPRCPECHEEPSAFEAIGSSDRIYHAASSERLFQTCTAIGKGFRVTYLQHFVTSWRTHGLRRNLVNLHF